VTTETRRRRIDPLKVVFALGYVLQGVANPWQGITYQPFIDHISKHYGLGAGRAQDFFGYSYLAWSFKPIIGFLVDAYGRTRTLLIGLLAVATLGYLVAPLVDTRAVDVLRVMFALSVVLAGSDVAIDRATVIAGDEEAQRHRPIAGVDRRPQPGDLLAAVYGSARCAASRRLRDRPRAVQGPAGRAGGGAAAGAAVRAAAAEGHGHAIPVTRSIAQFWAGLNSGAILGIMAVLLPDPLPADVRSDLHELRDRDAALLPDAARIRPTPRAAPVTSRACCCSSGRACAGRTHRSARAVPDLHRRRRRREHDAAGAAGAVFSAVTGALSHALPFVGPNGVRLALLCFDIGAGFGGDAADLDEHVQPGRAVVPVRGGGKLVRRVHVGSQSSATRTATRAARGFTNTGWRSRRCAACSAGCSGWPAGRPTRCRCTCWS
jgi:hypothetical protein